MSCENIFKNICHIHARLFDHRAAFQGHISYFAKEFEEKRGDRDKIQLDRIHEIVTENDKQTLPSIENFCREHLGTIKEKISNAEKESKTIIDNGENRKSELLETQRAAREDALSEFMKQQCVRSARVDQQFNDNVKLIENACEDLEMKLNQGGSLSGRTYYKFMAVGKEYI